MAELRIGCLVMAAGSGSRFGRNKLEAVVDGKSLLRRSLEAVPAEEFAQVTVVTQYDAAAALAEEFGFTVVRNDRPEDGLSRTVRLGTEAMAGCDAILYQVADQPLLEQDTVRRSSNTSGRIRTISWAWPITACGATRASFPGSFSRS
mgnify:CR=1 FL=1